MKAKSAIHLYGGQIVKLREPIDELVNKFAQMQRSAPGSAFEFTRITDHGSLKRIFIPTGHITRLEEL